MLPDPAPRICAELADVTLTPIPGAIHAPVPLTATANASAETLSSTMPVTKFTPLVEVALTCRQVAVVYVQLVVESVTDSGRSNRLQLFQRNRFDVESSVVVVVVVQNVPKYLRVKAPVLY